MPVDKPWSAATKEQLDRHDEIDRLCEFPCEERTFLYYMQAIWDHEPTRTSATSAFMTRGYSSLSRKTGDRKRVEGIGGPEGFAPIVSRQDRRSGGPRSGIPNVRYTPQQLCGVADLDSPLGYQANYANLIPLQAKTTCSLAHDAERYCTLFPDVVSFAAIRDECRKLFRAKSLQGIRQVPFIGATGRPRKAEGKKLRR